MQNDNISLAALIRIPSSAYFEFNAGITTLAVVDSFSLEGDDYNGSITFALENMNEVMSVLTGMGGSITEIIPERRKTKTTRAVAHYLNGSGKKTRSTKKTKVPRKARGGGPTKTEELIKLLDGKKWYSAKDLARITGWKPNIISARFIGVRKFREIEQKVGPDGLKVYRLAAAAA